MATSVVIDCGFFHVLSDDDRTKLGDVLRRVMTPGATYHLLCFSDNVPGDSGPRRIRQDDIRRAFADGFTVDSIAESSIDATFLDVPVPAWLATLTRQG